MHVYIYIYMIKELLSPTKGVMKDFGHHNFASSDIPTIMPGSNKR